MSKKSRELSVTLVKKGCAKEETENETVKVKCKILGKSKSIHHLFEEENPEENKFVALVK